LLGLRKRALPRFDRFRQAGRPFGQRGPCLFEFAGLAVQGFAGHNALAFEARVELLDAPRIALAELRTSYHTLRGEFGTLEQRAAELESQRDSLRRKLARVQQDARGLESDKAELTSEIAAARARLEQMEANLAAAEVERAALSAARDEASSEAHTLGRRIEAIRSRAATAEKLLSEARQSLVARAEEVRIADRKTAEATIARNTTQKLVEQLTAARDALEGKAKELERERASLIERSHILAETVKARETALGQAEQEIKSLTDRIAEIEVDAGTYRAKAERRIEELGESLQRERTGFAAARDALDGKRKEFEQARASLIERANKLEDTLAVRESALAQAEQRVKSLSERIAEMEADTAAYRSEAERRIEDLNERLARERTEFVGARDALDAKTMELELERTTLIERSNSLAESLKARESALGEAEQKIKSLSDHILEIELEVAAYRGQAEQCDAFTRSRIGDRAHSIPTAWPTNPLTLYRFTRNHNRNTKLYPLNSGVPAPWRRAKLHDWTKGCYRLASCGKPRICPAEGGIM
jgi:chromosome segregation ATPase